MPDRQQSTWNNIKDLGPIVAFIFGIVSIVWSLAGQISQNNAAIVYQGHEIDQLIKSGGDQQTLSYSISTQLAQLTQSVADIKAQTTRVPN